MRFRVPGRAAAFQIGDLPCKRNTPVVVQTERGSELGETIGVPRSRFPAELGTRLPRVLRLATDDDLARAEHNHGQETQAASVFRRDRLQSSSPNSGQTEAAAAGALGVQLGGTASYFGTEQHKPLIGGGLKPPEAGDIERCNRLIIVAVILFTATMMIIIGTFGALAGW